MNTQDNYIKNIVANAAKTDTVMPWTRGHRRAAFIAKRKEAEATEVVMFKRRTA